MAKHLAREMKPVVEILASEENEDLSAEEIAELILDAVKDVQGKAAKAAAERDAKKPKFVVVARISLDQGATWEFFVSKQYDTRTKAVHAGEALYSGTRGHLSVKWLALQVVEDFSALYKALEGESKEDESSAWVTGSVPLAAVKRTVWIEPEGEDDGP